MVEQRHTDEMHEASDQILRAALMALGTLRQRRARREQAAADRARVAARGSAAENQTYLDAQETFLRQGLDPSADPRWWDDATRAEKIATRDLADRYADASPYARTARDGIDAEAARRGEDLTPSDAEVITAEERDVGNDVDDESVAGRGDDPVTLGSESGLDAGAAADGIQDWDAAQRTAATEMIARVEAASSADHEAVQRLRDETQRTAEVAPTRAVTERDQSYVTSLAEQFSHPDAGDATLSASQTWQGLSPQQRAEMIDTVNGQKNGPAADAARIVGSYLDAQMALHPETRPGPGDRAPAPRTDVAAATDAMVDQVEQGYVTSLADRLSHPDAGTDRPSAAQVWQQFTPEQRAETLEIAQRQESGPASDAARTVTSHLDAQMELHPNTRPGPRTPDERAHTRATAEAGYVTAVGSHLQQRDNAQHRTAQQGGEQRDGGQLAGPLRSGPERRVSAPPAQTTPPSKGRDAAYWANLRNSEPEGMAARDTVAASFPRPTRSLLNRTRGRTTAENAPGGPSVQRGSNVER